MNAALTLAVVVVSAVVGPCLLAWLGGRQRSRERQEDHKREDELARRAAKVAEDLIATNAAVAKTAEMTNGKLDVIHTLVNSNMTAAMQAELDATVRELAMMREVIALNQAAGREPSQEALVAIRSTEGKIGELQVALADRLKQNAIAEALPGGGV